MERVKVSTALAPRVELYQVSFLRFELPSGLLEFCFLLVDLTYLVIQDSHPFGLRHGPCVRKNENGLVVVT